MGRLMNEFKQDVKEYQLVPTGGGAFEVSVNGDLIYSKLKSGQFPDENWVLDTVRKRVK